MIDVMVSAAGCARFCFGLSAYFAKFKLLYEEPFRLVSTAFSRAIRLLDDTILLSYSGLE